MGLRQVFQMIHWNSPCDLVWDLEETCRQCCQVLHTLLYNCVPDQNDLFLKSATASTRAWLRSAGEGPAVSYTSSWQKVAAELACWAPLTTKIRRSHFQLLKHLPLGRCWSGAGAACFCSIPAWQGSWRRAAWSRQQIWSPGVTKTELSPCLCSIIKYWFLDLVMQEWTRNLNGRVHLRF